VGIAQHFTADPKAPGDSAAHTFGVADDIAAGRLVAPFALSLPSAFAYYLACPAATARRPKVRAFWEWVKAETASHRR
jgi:LysR family glycine cleavage system transcriptional activator